MSRDVYIQIAAYRDPELVPTIEDCLARAADPGRLRFGICWQREASESLGRFVSDSRFTIIDIPYQRARGVGWARNQLQQHYGGQRYTLLIDSHHRFVEGWDDLCIKMLEGLVSDGVEKPVLTSYLPAYEPANADENRGQDPWCLRFSGFNPDGPFEVVPEAITGFQELDQPIPARFFSAHFAFTVGQFCREVPYDPMVYFFGEEPSLAVRLFTHGYDLFHPHRVLMWHHYGRLDRPKHWGDDPLWIFHNERSLRRVRALFGLSNEGADRLAPFNLGTRRTLLDYQAYAGLNFQLKGALAETLDNLPPRHRPSVVSREAFDAEFLTEQSIKVKLSRNEQPAENVKDFDFWYLGVHGANGVELIRKDLTGVDIDRLHLPPYTYELRCSLAQTPVSWTVWPHSRSLGWLDKITRAL